MKTAIHWHDQEMEQKEVNEQLLLALQRERAEKDLKDKVEAQKAKETEAQKVNETPVKSPEDLPLKKRRGRPPAVGAEVKLGAARKMTFGHMTEEMKKANEARSAKLRGMLQERTTDDFGDQDSSTLFGDETAELLNDVVGDIVDRLGNSELGVMTPTHLQTVSSVNVSPAPPQGQVPAEPLSTVPGLVIPADGLVIPVENEDGEILVKLFYDKQGNVTTSDGSQPPEVLSLHPIDYVTYADSAEKENTEGGQKKEENETDKPEETGEKDTKAMSEIEKEKTKESEEQTEKEEDADN